MTTRVFHQVWREMGKYWGIDWGIGPDNDIVWPRPDDGGTVSVIASPDAIASYEVAWNAANSGEMEKVRELWKSCHIVRVGESEAFVV